MIQSEDNIHYQITTPEGKTISGKEADKLAMPDWTKHCEVCGVTPILSLTGMCGPCTFGEADTAGGNW